MSLLREIQAAAIDENTSVPTLLLKCQLLAARIDHGELAAWVRSEFDGYPPETALPDYRKVGYGRATGTFTGPFGRGGSNIPISMGNVEEEHRDDLFNLDLRQPVAALQELSESGEELGVPWPGHYVAYYGRPDIFVENMALAGATTHLPRTAVTAALSAIRSRALAVATEIEKADPAAGEGLAGEDPLPRETKQAITHNIYGGNVIIQHGPTPEQIVEQIVEALELAAEEATEPNEKGRLRQAGEVVGSVAREVVADVIARQITA